MSSEHTYVDFEYKVRFEKKGSAYRLQHYNQWHQSDEKTFDDIRVMFEGKDLEGNDLSLYKVIKWEDLEDGIYNSLIEMKLYETRDKTVEQFFTLKSIDKDGELSD